MDTEFANYQDRIEALELENSILREKLKQQHSNSEKVMDSERKFRTLFENSQAAISFFNSDYQLVMHNETNAQMLGGKKEDFIGKSIHDFFPENADFYIDRFEQVIATGEAKLFEDAYTLPGGTKWFSSLLQPIFNYEEQLEGIQVIAIDITEKKQGQLEI
jgi:PAS domain S-box-containing protein